MTFIATARRTLGAGAALVTTLVAASAAAQTAPPPPCLGDPAYEQFGYMLGQWDILHGGAKSADLTFSRDFAGCGFVLTFKAAAPGGQSGMGLFTFSRAKNSPIAVFVGDQGAATVAARGEIHPGELVLFNDDPLPDGKGTRTRTLRITRQPDGTLLEAWTISENGGPAKPLFDLVWRKKPVAN